MDLLNSLTLVIPSHNRPLKLLRALRYYLSFQSIPWIVICDSTAEECQISEFKKLVAHPRVNYRRYPATVVPFDKVMDALELVKTPYSCFAADDDLVTEHGLRQALGFLDMNHDYVACHGQAISFAAIEELPSPKFLWKFEPDAHSVENDDVTMRVLEHTKNYFPTIYSVQRYEQKYSTFKGISQFTNDERFAELLPSVLLVIEGKIKALDILYSVREHFTSRASKPLRPGIPEFALEGTLDSKKIKYLQPIRERLIMAGLTPEKADQVIETHFSLLIETHPADTCSVTNWKSTLRTLPGFSILKACLQWLRNKGLVIQPELATHRNSVPAHHKYERDLREAERVLLHDWKSP